MQYSVKGALLIDVKLAAHEELSINIEKKSSRPVKISTAFLARLYESTGRAIAVTLASVSALALLKMLKFLVKVFMSLYPLKLWMDQVDTLHVGRYWSEVLCCTIMTHLGDLEVKVTEFCVKVFG